MAEAIALVFDLNQLAEQVVSGSRPALSRQFVKQGRHVGGCLAGRLGALGICLSGTRIGGQRIGPADQLLARFPRYTQHPSNDDSWQGIGEVVDKIDRLTAVYGCEQFFDESFNFPSHRLYHRCGKGGVHQASQPRVVGWIHVSDPGVKLVEQGLQLRAQFGGQLFGVGRDASTGNESRVLQRAMHVLVTG